MLNGAKQTNDTRGINYARIRSITADFSQGGLAATGRALDVAIDGPGFLQIEKNNETFYTRAGRMTLDSNGMVKTEDGFTVLGAGDNPLQIDTALGKNIVIAESGEIFVNGEDSGSRIRCLPLNEKQAGQDRQLALPAEGRRPISPWPSTGCPGQPGNLQRQHDGGDDRHDCRPTLL
jgi:flagellar hook-basal body protein